MQENLAASLDYIMEVFEDGTVNEHEPASVGGISKWGVTLFALADLCKRQGASAPTADTIRALTEDQARQFYTAAFADRIRFNDLPGGVDFSLLDFEINLGPHGGVELAAVATGFFPIPAAMTDELVAHIRSMDARCVIGAIAGAWLGMKYGKGGDEWTAYEHGWSNRLIGSDSKALAMVK
jgi:lysozyme family protein